MSQHFLHYIITNTLEQHKGSTTYLALQDHGPARTFVLKIFHEPGFKDANAQERFLQEAETFSRLSDAHIVPIIEASAEKDQTFIASGYLPNGSLRIRLERAYLQRLPIQQAITIIAQIGQGLAYLHTLNLIHGQLKPEHILFNARGQALLADPYFSTYPTPWDSNNERASSIYRYLAPEQFAGESSPLSDQYALCCIAYELLTGLPPFTLNDPQVLKEQQLHSTPRPLSSILPDISPLVEQAILKGLAKEPGQRHADIATLLSTLQTSKSYTHANLPLSRAKRMRRVLASAMSVQATSTEQEEHNPSSSVAPDNTGIFASLFGAKIFSLRHNRSLSHSLDDNRQINKPADLSETPMLVAQASTSGALAELLQEMGIEEELLLPENTVYATRVEPAAANRQPATPMHLIDGYKNERLSSYQEDDDKNALQLSQAGADHVGVQSQPGMPDDDLVVAGTPTVPMHSTNRLPSVSALKARSMQIAAHLFVASRAYMHGKAFANSLAYIHNRALSKRTALGALLLLVMIISLVLYSTFAVAATKSSSLAMFATITAQTPASTVDALEVLPPATATSRPVATATPKPTPKPKPTPTAIPTPTPTAIPVPTPTTLPVYIPPTPTIAPTPTPTPVPTPPQLYSNTIATQSNRFGTVMLAFIPNVVVTNVRIEADIVIQGNIGGVIFRSTPGNNYTMRIGTDGNYDLENSARSLASGISLAIRKGNNVSNHLTIIARGDQITVSVNGTQIINLQDSSSSTGNIGVLAADFGIPTTSTCVLNVYGD